MKKMVIIIGVVASAFLLNGQMVLAAKDSSYVDETVSGVQETKKGIGVHGLWDFPSVEPRTRTYSPKPVSTGYDRTSIAYPTGRSATSILYLEKHFPTIVKIGEEFDYTIKVTNLTNLNLNDVSVFEEIPSSFNVIKMDPDSSRKSGTQTVWDFGQLGPNGSKLITITGKASSKADIPCCTTADYGLPALCHTTGVIQPALSIDLTASDKVLVCDLIQLDYTVKNTGDSVLRNVTVKTDLPEGTSTTSGAGTLSKRIGNLAVGESIDVTEFVRTDDTGTYSFSASATDGDVSASSSAASTTVVQPAISVTAKAERNKQYVGRTIGFMFDVKNTSGIDAEDTVLVAKIPYNTRFKSASDGGRSSGGSVRWDLGSLKSFGTESVSMELTATGSGNAMTEAKADADCCDADADTAKVSIVGIPALLLEVIDVMDPIEIGKEESYKIQVTNQGTAAANNIVIVAELPGMDYVSSSGDTTGSVSGNTVTFEALSTLSPKQTANWTVRAKGTKEGDQRFKVKMNSAELTSAVEETESTYVY